MRISEVCMQTIPCEHYVSIDGGDERRLDAAEIIRWHLARMQPVPEHFNAYYKGRVEHKRFIVARRAYQYGWSEWPHEERVWEERYRTLDELMSDSRMMADSRRLQEESLKREKE